MDTDAFNTPGQFITALLEERGWSKKNAAMILNIEETAFNRVVTDKKPVSVDLALALEDVIGVPAESFLSLQQKFDLAKARLTALPNPDRKTRAQMFGDLPIGKMISRGWLRVENPRNTDETEAAVKEFFGAESTADIETISHAAKKTNADEPATPSQLAWLYRVQSIAKEMLVARYSQEALESAIKKFYSLRGAPEHVRHVPRALAEAGVRLVIVEALPGAKIDGVCLWLNHSTPVVGMSLRHDRIDNFWFVLRHELEHVRLKHGLDDPIIDIELDGNRGGTGGAIAEQELLANRAAANFCVPMRDLQDLIDRKEPFFHERDLLGFAATLGIHPGLVAGQLQRRTGRYDRFRSHLAKVRSSLLPSATVDGWGDVYPLGA